MSQTPFYRLTQCSFCGRSSRDTGRMVEGPAAVYICALCVEVALKLLDGELKGGTITKPAEPGSLPPEAHAATEH